ncbi:MAG: hypothetical protein LBQ40_06915 [Clostridiales bacterium]|jgi:hypothetical protein|nr:hypothetical protein [Clostridiales bacterium]
MDKASLKAVFAPWLVVADAILFFVVCDGGVHLTLPLICAMLCYILQQVSGRVKFCARKQNIKLVRISRWSFFVRDAKPYGLPNALNAAA